MQHSDDSNQYEIENKILELQQDVCEFWATLNEQGIWLFLATLGCWSVTDLTTKRLAFVATFFIFYKTTNNILKPFLKGSSFDKRAKKIKQSIERQLEKSHSSLHLPPSPPILGGSDSQSPPILGDLGFDVSAQPNVDECNVFTTFQTASEKISSAEDWQNRHLSKILEIQNNEKPSLKWLRDHRVYFISMMFYGWSVLELLLKRP